MSCLRDGGVKQSSYGWIVQGNSGLLLPHTLSRPWPDSLETAKTKGNESARQTRRITARGLRGASWTWGLVNEGELVYAPWHDVAENWE